MLEGLVLRANDRRTGPGQLGQKNHTLKHRALHERAASVSSHWACCVAEPTPQHRTTSSACRAPRVPADAWVLLAETWPCSRGGTTANERVGEALQSSWPPTPKKSSESLRTSEALELARPLLREQRAPGCSMASVAAARRQRGPSGAASVHVVAPETGARARQEVGDRPAQESRRAAALHQRSAQLPGPAQRQRRPTTAYGQQRAPSSATSVSRVA